MTTELSGHSLTFLAMTVAATAHKGQKRWGGEPYIVHPKAVAEEVVNVYRENIDFDMIRYAEFEDDLKTVAWLHDVVEDSWISLTDLREYGFPERVIDAVDAITHRENESYVDYIERAYYNNLARFVKIADLRDNSKTLDVKKNRQRREKYELAEAILMGRF